jgi:hypothetical protein
MSNGKCIAALLSLFFSVSLVAGEPAQKNDAKAEITFLEGAWRGTMGDAVIEEIWSAPENGWYVGMFRLIREGQPRLYEIIAIGPVEEGLTMYLRHFGSRFEAWEPVDAPMIFDLEKLDVGQAVFRQRGADTTLTYALDTPDRLLVTLEKTRDDQRETTTFVYQRVK